MPQEYKYKIPYIKTKKQNSNTIIQNSYNKNKVSNVGNKLLSQAQLFKNKAGDLVHKVEDSNWLTIQNVLLFFLIIILLYILVALIVYVFSDCKKKTVLDYLLGTPFEPCGEGKGQEQTSYIEREILDEKEVFHIANQDYTYEQAKCKCAAYGGRLATKDEVIEAYNKGANWCSYGWSQGQSAYYPIQKCYWDKLADKRACGKPGINGGFFANPLLKFGINCYGIKPKGRVVQPKPARCDDKTNFCGLKRNYGSNNILDTDIISPFDKSRWSQFD